ncbi:hypothetical protein F4823DRAFT_316167 [Ustulina deusta]|nr:hypothetical protein F4823DRAFT_316167 [Ustulina deusta]
MVALILAPSVPLPSPNSHCSLPIARIFASCAAAPITEQCHSFHRFLPSPATILASFGFWLWLLVLQKQHLQQVWKFNHLFLLLICLAAPASGASAADLPSKNAERKVTKCALHLAEPETGPAFLPGQRSFVSWFSVLYSLARAYFHFLVRFRCSSIERQSLSSLL